MADSKGWSIDKRNKSKPYHAQLTSEGKRIWLGSFATKEEAAAAYEKARPLYPVLPASGGNIHYRPPRKVCDNCLDDYASTKFEIHVAACKRKYPVGKPQGRKK